MTDEVPVAPAPTESVIATSGGLITCLLELCFSSNEIGIDINLTHLGCEDSTKLLFSENTGIIIQSEKNLILALAMVDNTDNHIYFSHKYKIFLI